MSRTTALGRTTTYRIQSLPAGGQRRTNVSPTGLATVTTIGADGTTVSSTPDGMVTEVTEAGDARAGMQAPVLRRTVTRSPGLKVSTVTGGRRTVLADPDDPFSLVLQVDSLIVNGRLFRTTYDAATRTTTSVTPVGRVSGSRVDSLGRVVAEHVPGFDSVLYNYDARGRLAETRQGGRQWLYGYGPDGRLATVTDPLQRTSGFAYDSAGRVVEQTLADGRVVGYAYDDNGNLTAVTPPGRDPHAFDYTAVDLTDQYGPPAVAEGPTPTRYAYNLDRQLTAIVRPGGDTVAFAYDTAGRPSSVAHADGSLGYAYSSATGNLTSVTTPAATLAFAYDGSLLTGTSWTGAVSGAVGVTYDNDFRITTMAVNGVNPVGFNYDQDGLLTAAGALGIHRSLANGRVDSTTLGGVTTIERYDTFGQWSERLAVAAGDALYHATYVRDSLGRITVLTDVVGLDTTASEYGYDPAGRLETVTTNGVVTAAYQYDLNGNRLSVTRPSGVETGTYDGQDRLLTYAGTTYAYTPAGELRFAADGADTTFYHYDALGNLLEVTLADGTQIEYVVDGFNRRIGKRVNGTLVQGFLYQDQLNPVAELDGAGTVVSRFVYGTRANVPDFLIKAGVTYRVVADHLGSVRLVVNTSDGTVAQEIRYDEFGRELVNTSPGFQPFGFAGGIADGLTGLVRFGARDYQPGAGRWTAKDPALFAGGDANLYAYVLADPVNFFDPLGLQWLRDLANFAAGFGDALTFGLTDKVRDLIGANDVIDKCSGWYRGGEWVEIGAELALTGGSAALRGAARTASRSAVRQAARRETGHVARNGMELHHSNPLFGHPGGAETLFPTGGLPASIHSGGWNTQLLTRADHLRAHERLRQLENGMRTGFNPLTTGARAAGNVLRNCGCNR